MGIKVAEWIRVSDESQAAPERFGIPAQRSVNRETCRKNGLEIVQTFQVEDVSGRDVMSAPETKDLIELMQSGRIQGVVSREFSRLMRPDDFADYYLLGVFQKTNTLLYLPEGPIDLNEKMGRLMASMQAAIAGFERSTIRERLHRGNEENRKSGGRFASTLPLGVGHSKEQGWYYTDDSAKVVTAYDMVLSGESLNSIARHLGLSAMGARYLIHNPIYKGWRVYEREVADARPGKNGRQPKYRPTRKRSEDKIIRVQVIEKPLVSPETWERACQILDIKSDQHRRERKGSFASYNGFLFCDECGRLLTPVKGSARNHPERRGYYVCLGHARRQGCTQGYFRIDDLELQIDELIGQQMTDPAFAKRILGSEKDLEKTLSRIEGLRSQQLAGEKKRGRIVDMFADGTITRAERDERLAKIKDQTISIEEEILRLESASRSSGMPADELWELFAGIFNRWSSLEKEERRKILGLHMPKIRVRDGKVVSIFRMLDGREVKCKPLSLLPLPKGMPKFGNQIRADKKSSANSSSCAPAR